MDLILIAHPDFSPWLIEEAKGLKLIYKDKACLPGKGGEYPESLAIHSTTRSVWLGSSPPGCKAP